jgi:hypothetical protein
MSVGQGVQIHEAFAAIRAAVQPALLRKVFLKSSRRHTCSRESEVEALVIVTIARVCGLEWD